MQYTTLNDKITAMKTIMTYSSNTRVSALACKFIMLEIIDCTCRDILMLKLYVVKKRHEQVEKTLEMKSGVGMALVMKQGTAGRNVYDVLAI